MKTARRIPSREEWNFDAFTKDFTERRLYFCFTYEYARSVAAIVRRIRYERQLGLPYEIKLLLRPSDTGEVSAARENWEMLQTNAEFPRVPFMKSSFKDQPEESFEDLHETPAMQPVTQLDGRWLGGMSLTEISPEEVETFTIRWDRSPDAILSDFKKYLHVVHPGEGGKGKGVSQKKTLRANLKALGVWRLLRFCKGDIAKARKIVYPAEPEKALYSRDEDWLKARARAQRIIDDWSKREPFGLERFFLCRMMNWN